MKAMACMKTTMIMCNRKQISKGTNQQKRQPSHCQPACVQECLPGGNEG